MRARKEGAQLADLPLEKQFDLLSLWRQSHPDVELAKKEYPLPSAFLGGSREDGPAFHSEDSRRSFEAFEKQVGRRVRASDVDGFRAAVAPLVAEATRTGRLFSPKLLALIGDRGGEHSVIFTPGRVLKLLDKDMAGGVVTYSEEGEPRVFRGTLPEYLRQTEQNASLAGDTARVEGIMKEGRAIRVVLSQTAVDGIAPNYEEIERAFRQNGYLPVDQDRVLGQEGPELWWNPEVNIGIADAKPDNLVKTERNELVPIDVKAFTPSAKAEEWMWENLSRDDKAFARNAQTARGGT